MGTEISRWLGDLRKLHSTVSNCGSRIERSSLAERGLQSSPCDILPHRTTRNAAERKRILDQYRFAN